MRFHHAHGSAITLSNDRLHAYRDEQFFCDGIVFGDQPLTIGCRISIQLTCIRTWKGALRIGVTSHDPQHLQEQQLLPRYACPDLVKQDGFWVRLIAEQYAVSYHILTFYVNSLGELHFSVNNHYTGILLDGIPTQLQLWFLLDLYGNTAAVKIIIADDAPKEIFARGEVAMRAYEKACLSGIEALYRTRLMLVGKDKVGKTSLKKSLLGQKHNKEIESTDGVDLSESCSFSTRDAQAWRLAISGNNQSEEDKLSLEPQNQQGIIGGAAVLEEESEQAAAMNVYLEMLFQKREKESKHKNSFHKDKNTKKSEKENRSHSSMLSCGVGSKVSPGAVTRVPQELLKDIAAGAIEKLQAMLEEQPLDKWLAERAECQQEKEAEKVAEIHDREVTLDIWDFAGQAVYYTTHQVFLSSRAIYVIVFNMCDDFSAMTTIKPVSDNIQDAEILTEELSSLGYIDYWMKSIHVHAAENTKNSITNTTLSPPIFIVGTHRNSLNDDVEIQKEMVEKKFDQLHQFLVGKPYYKHIVKPFFAVENCLNEGEDIQVCHLREQIQKSALQEPYMGEQIPTRWIQFEHIITQLVENANNYACVDQITDLASDLGIEDQDEVQTMLEFYHDLGLIVYYGGGSGTVDNILRNLVILSPQWLVDMFRRIITAWQPVDEKNSLIDKWQQLEKSGILDDELVNYLWADDVDQKMALLGLLEKFDLICKRIPSKVENSSVASYYVPGRFHLLRNNKNLFMENTESVTFYLNFLGFLPEALFHRMLTHAIRWSQECGGCEPYLYYRVARLFLDNEHDFVLEMMPSSHEKVKVVVMRVTESREDGLCIDDKSEKTPLIPSPHAVAKVRNFLDSALLNLREMWMKRISYTTCVSCPCGRPCDLHHKVGCTQEICLHFLDIDECLTKKVICCGHRRVKTGFVQKWFPNPASVALKKTVLANISVEGTNGNVEKELPDLPQWMKSAAKLLNSGIENQDWICLANHLGYKKSKFEKFNNDLNPSLALLTDWILSSGNTQVSIDVLLTFLEQMSRYDIIEIFQEHRNKAGSSPPPQVFISYQWDSQDEVQALWDRLERAGYSCWMDIGQLGGGDQLYNRIEHGIRNCKIVLACITPKYVVSQHCSRELNLADLLRKPILPVMFETVVWPPPGGMALIFSNLLYINMKGIGGHGGTGIHADLEDKYNEIIQRISHYSVPETSTSTQGDPPAPAHSKVSHKEKGEVISNAMQETLSNATPMDFQRYMTTQGSNPNLTLQFPTHSTHYPRTTPPTTNQNAEPFSWRCGSCNLL